MTHRAKFLWTFLLLGAVLILGSACSEKSDITFDALQRSYVLFGTGSGDGNPKATIFLNFDVAPDSDKSAAVEWHTVELDIGSIFWPDRQTCNDSDGLLLEATEAAKMSVLDDERPGLQVEVPPDREFCQVRLQFPENSTFKAQGLTKAGQVVSLELDLGGQLAFVPEEAFLFSADTYHFWLALIDLEALMSYNLLTQLEADSNGVLHIDATHNIDFTDTATKAIIKAFSLNRDADRNGSASKEEATENNRLATPPDEGVTEPENRALACHKQRSELSYTGDAVFYASINGTGFPTNHNCSDLSISEDLSGKNYEISVFEDLTFTLGRLDCTGGFPVNIAGRVDEQEWETFLELLNEQIPELPCNVQPDGCFDAGGGDVWLFEPQYSEGIGFNYYCVFQETVSQQQYEAVTAVEETIADFTENLQNTAITNSRTLIEDTQGLCTTRSSITFDDTCATRDDCTAYRNEAEMSCCDSLPMTPLSCTPVNVNHFPSYPDCTADNACQFFPVDCVEGHCVADYPDDTCAQDSDCKILSKGCVCAAANVNVDASDYTAYTAGVCPAEVPCPQDAEVHCINEQCVLVGTYMDSRISHYCGLLNECCELMDTCEAGFLQTCIDGLTADNYKEAVAQWAIIESGQYADTCEAFFEGPGKGLIDCITVLCP